VGNLGPFPLVNRSASITVTFVSPSDGRIVAAYSGDARYLRSDRLIIHTVNPGRTTTAIAVAGAARYGETHLRTTTSILAPAVGTVKGTMTIAEGFFNIGTDAVSNGAATVDLSLLKPGSHFITATYGGSDTMTGSVSGPFQIVIEPAFAQIEVVVVKSSVQVLLYAPASVPETPTGLVTVTENGSVLAPDVSLAPGRHTLHVTYSGDGLFRPLSRDVDVEVPVETSRHRGVRH
jgi:hypothetical protein